MVAGDYDSIATMGKDAFWALAFFEGASRLGLALVPYSWNLGRYPHWLLCVAANLTLHSYARG